MLTALPGASLGPERHLHHFRRQLLAAAIDLELRPCLGGGDGEVGGADAGAEARAHGAAADDVHFPALGVHRIAMPGEAAALEAEADQAAGDAVLLLGTQGLVSGEGRALVQLHDPAEPGLERGGGVVDLVAVEGVSHLQPERIPGAETDRRGAGGGDRLPQRDGVAVPAVELEAVLAGVAGAGDEALRSRYLPHREAIVADVVEWGVAQGL